MGEAYPSMGAAIESSRSTRRCISGYAKSGNLASMSLLIKRRVERDDSIVAPIEGYASPISGTRHASFAHSHICEATHVALYTQLH